MIIETEEQIPEEEGPAIQTVTITSDMVTVDPRSTSETPRKLGTTELLGLFGDAVDAFADMRAELEAKAKEVFNYQDALKAKGIRVEVDIEFPGLTPIKMSNEVVPAHQEGEIPEEMGKPSVQADRRSAAEVVKEAHAAVEENSAQNQQDFGTGFEKAVLAGFEDAGSKADKNDITPGGMGFRMPTL